MNPDLSFRLLLRSVFHRRNWVLSLFTQLTFGMLSLILVSTLITGREQGLLPSGVFRLTLEQHGREHARPLTEIDARDLQALSSVAGAKAILMGMQRRTGLEIEALGERFQVRYVLEVLSSTQPLQVMGQRILFGSGTLPEHDGVPSVLISETLARVIFGAPHTAPGQSMLVLNPNQTDSAQTLKVTGVFTDEDQGTGQVEAQLVIRSRLPLVPEVLVRTSSDAQNTLQTQLHTALLQRLNGRLPPNGKLRFTQSDRDQQEPHEVDPMLFLFCALGALLVGGCAVNLFSLTLENQHSRQKDRATRLTLGASPWRLFIDTLLELLLIFMMAFGGAVLLSSPMFLLLRSLAGGYLFEKSLTLQTASVLWALAVSFLMLVVGLLLPLVITYRDRPLHLMRGGS